MVQTTASARNFCRGRSQFFFVFYLYFSLPSPYTIRQLAFVGEYPNCFLNAVEK